MIPRFKMSTGWLVHVWAHGYGLKWSRARQRKQFRALRTLTRYQPISGFFY